MMPARTSIRSNSGQLCRNSRYSALVQNPITRSTPARLYQLRSNRTISPAAGQVRYIALKIPLTFLPFSRRAQRHHAADAGSQRLGDPLDGASLACGVPPFEQDHHLETLVPNQLMELHQFDLQPSQFLVVVPILAQA